MLGNSTSNIAALEASNRSCYTDVQPLNRKWSANCLELISVRLDHLDKRYSSILAQYDRNHKTLEKKLENINQEVQKMEDYMIQNHQLTEAYSKILDKVETKMAEIRSDAQNWLGGLSTAVDTHARQQLDAISFDANIMQEQRDLIKLDDMVERLRALHGTTLQELTEMIDKRQMAEKNIMQMITDETEKLKSARQNYEKNKEEARATMSSAVADLKRSLMEELNGMILNREEFEDLVLETLEQQMGEFTVTKVGPADT